MRVAFLTTRLEKPSARYRFLHYLPYLAENGVDVDTFVLPANKSERSRLFRSFSEYDVVFLQKRTFGILDWRVLRKHARAIIYDFDDAVMFEDPAKAKKSGRSAEEKPTRLSRFKRVVGGSDAVIAGNKYLYDWALKYNKSSFLVPTPVDVKKYGLKEFPGEREFITIGWIGSASTLHYLEALRPLLDELHDHHPGTRLKIVADKFFDCERMPVIKKMWNSEEEISDLHSIDIGIMPLTDDAWSCGKCGFKLLQYMAVGTCAVASPVGVNQEIIRDGKNGFLAGYNVQWFEIFSKLINNMGLRKQIGLKARETVLDKYSLEVNAPKLLNVLKSVAGKE